MKITRESILTGITNTLEIEVTTAQLERVANMHSTGEHVEDILSHLPASQREFIMTGILIKTWDEHLKLSTLKNFYHNE